jgi:hypothetical protein
VALTTVISVRSPTKCVRRCAELPRPTLIDAGMGMINTLINVYTAQGGTWSVTATVTVTVTASFTFVSGVLVLLYNWLLGRVKKLA